MDGMVTLQVIKGKWTTFGELCNLIFSIFHKAARYWKAKRVDFVTDRYLNISIKNPKRNKRAVSSAVQKINVHSKNQWVPKQWKKSLSVGENKESLIAFMCEHWCSYTSSALGNLDAIYATSINKCFQFTRGESGEQFGGPQRGDGTC